MSQIVYLEYPYHGDPEDVCGGPEAICLCDDGPLHIGRDHRVASRLEEIGARCSICDLPWDNYDQSVHDACRRVDDEGRVWYGKPILFARDPDSNIVAVQYR